ncbi:hypothetical protein [Alphaentomopoxvirus acuprea]|uniref:Uncharacterized protein n=1 Tax=Alphaentomopoxvirus acuprea TaxID=62099 RepID=W6JIJ7_9POXV|nr:hypothetical protein BA82_gp023 [Anomala cuprea entomopoxvirus]BAO49383.1 hypothetical protein [Anomala cuprea entomopoxvirus]
MAIINIQIVMIELRHNFLCHLLQIRYLLYHNHLQIRHLEIALAYVNRMDLNKIEFLL